MGQREYNSRKGIVQYLSMWPKMSKTSNNYARMTFSLHEIVFTITIIYHLNLLIFVQQPTNPTPFKTSPSY